MTGLLYPFLIVGLALVAAAEMHRRQKASGIRTNWTKTLVTGLGTVVIGLCSVAILIVGLESNYPAAGVVTFVLVFVTGLAVLVTFVNKRWPMRSSRDVTPDKP